MVEPVSTIHRSPGFCKGLLGEGEEVRPFEGMDTAHPPLGFCNGLCGVRQEGRPSGLGWVACGYL